MAPSLLLLQDQLHNTDLETVGEIDLDSDLDATRETKLETDLDMVGETDINTDLEATRGANLETDLETAGERDLDTDLEAIRQYFKREIPM